MGEPGGPGCGGFKVRQRLGGGPGSYDQKIYASGIGIVLEQALSGGTETAALVSVTGR